MSPALTPPVFANSATITVAEHRVLAGGGHRPVRLGVRFGVWAHPDHGPVLIDTGYGPEVTEGRRSLPLMVYAAVLRPRLEDQPEDVLARLGFHRDDVKTIVLTHFHADHISGLRRFPKARVVAAGWGRWKAQSAWHRLRHGVFDELLPGDFEARLTSIEDRPVVDLPFGRAHDLFGDGRLLALPLPGHATGHCGLVWPDEKLIYAADAQWLGQAMRENRPPRGLARLVYEDEAAMAASLSILRAAESAGFTVRMCHDPVAHD
jgi:glyoxylase-like metal-dependent hydrolase (beta-lactamase superfamily II)